MAGAGPDRDDPVAEAVVPKDDGLAARDDCLVPRGDRVVPRGEALAADDELRLQHARDIAWRALGRRDRTVAEIAQLLHRKRVEPSTIDIVVADLCEQGYLDDERYARQFADDRRRLDGWGAERIERRLRALGIGGELIAAAVGERDHEGELEAAVALLRRRFPDPPATPRDCERALGVLVRKGYELELAHDALRRHAGVPAFE